MPVLNEALYLTDYLLPLQSLRERHCELIIVDGGSSDASPTVAQMLADQVLQTSTGRSAQMNAGARAARKDILWFLHSDTQVPPNADFLILQALRERLWGRFDVRLSGHQGLFRIVETGMNWRSRLTGIATGDQGIFVRRETFFQVKGYPDIALMEDIALSRALKRLGRPACLHERLTTSSRRWEQNGILRTILLMWYLRFAYFCGADSHRLAQIYYR